MDSDDRQTRARPPRTPVGPRRPKYNQDMSLSYTDAGVQARPDTPPKSAPPTFVAPPPLTPPPPISFESTPIPWKGLPLEAAQWTFSSPELQEIVSKAIRLSARDSFVRLLSLQALEVDIVHESDRLETARLAAQAKWRFEVARRTMLVHALNACAAFSAPGPGSDQPEAENPIVGFVGQLATAIASSDSLLSTILEIADQQSQIALIQHQHWASALGIALRKLNRSYERQAQELKRAQSRIQTLEDELEEAWREAEKMAIEFDDLEEEIATSESDHASLADGADPDAVDIHPDQDSKHDLDETGTLGDITIQTDIAIVGVTATAVFSKATLITPAPAPKLVDKSDAKSIRSVKSTRSRRSTRDGQSHFLRLSSARIRSRAASNASLRLPKALRSAPSPVDAPPLPSLPPPNVPGDDSFLEMDNDFARKVLPKRHPEPTLALPTPPHSAGLPPTRVPSIWLESDIDGSMHLNAPDRSHSLQILSSLSPHKVKIRRSNLVMSLTGSNRSSDGYGSGSGSGSEMAIASEIGIGSEVGLGMEMGDGTETRTCTASPTSNHSPVSLPTALAHFRGPSASSSSHSTPPTSLSVGVDGGVGTDVGAGVGVAAERGVMRPGSAGARLTTTCEEQERETQRQVNGTQELAMAVGSCSPEAGSRRSIMSRASSVILRRLSQATIGSTGGGSRAGGASRGGGRGVVTAGKGVLGSPSKVRDGSRLGGVVERWKDRHEIGNGNADDGDGEVMLIGSPYADAFDGL